MAYYYEIIDMSDVEDELDMITKIMLAVSNHGGSKGLSLNAVKKHLSSGMDKVPDSKSIQASLKSGVDKGLLSKLSNGNYKIDETIGRIGRTDRKSTIEIGYRSKMNEVKDKSKDIAQNGSSKLSDSKNKLKKTAGSTRKSAQNVNAALGKKFQLKLDEVKDKSKKLSQDTSSKHSDAKDKLGETAGSTKEAAQDAKAALKSSVEDEFHPSSVLIVRRFGFQSKLDEVKDKSKELFQDTPQNFLMQRNKIKETAGAVEKIVQDAQNAVNKK